MATGVAARSLDRFLSEDDRIVLLHDRCPRAELDRVTACIERSQVLAFDCSERVHDAWTPPPHVTPAAFFRYLAPDLVGESLRCVYLDVDVVVRRDPTPLHDQDLDGSMIGAVRSRVAPYFASPGGVQRWRDAGVPSTAPYFNSGVLVMDLERWRARDVTRRLTEYLEQYGSDAYLADQEALNVAVVGDWFELDRTWNYITHVAESFLQEPGIEPDDPAIVHFAGRAKPWSPGRQPIFTEDWYDVLAGTPWSEFAPRPPEPPSGLRAAVRRTAGRALRRVRDLARE